MSSELKAMLSKVFEEDNSVKEIDFEEGINRYKSLLLRVAKIKPYDVVVSSEGTEVVDMKEDLTDLDLLEKAHLLNAQTKETGRNIYRQYELTPEGAELVEKLSKET